MLSGAFLFCIPVLPWFIWPSRCLPVFCRRHIKRLLEFLLMIPEICQTYSDGFGFVNWVRLQHTSSSLMGLQKLNSFKALSYNDLDNSVL